MEKTFIVDQLSGIGLGFNYWNGGGKARKESLADMFSVLPWDICPQDIKTLL